MPTFIPGLELSRLFYLEAVRPILDAEYPGLVYSAGLLGSGSEVLGFDTPMSTDHNWGPQVVLYLAEGDREYLADSIRETLGHQLPLTFRGYSTHFEQASYEPGTMLLTNANRRPINHHVRVTSLERMFGRHIGVAPDAELTVGDWLTIPEHKLLSLTSDGVFHDGLNALGPMQRCLSYYPRDVWLYLLSAQWQRIGQEEPFVGRTGTVGDEIGSSVIAARLVRDIMRLCFLIERQYAPYSKWFGTAFARLDCSRRLTHVLRRVLRAIDWREREEHLSSTYGLVAAMHNGLAITEPMPEKVSAFHSRPFLVIQGEAFARAIWACIEDEDVKSLPFGVGKVDQFLDSTDVLSHTDRCRTLRALYDRGE